MDGLVAVSFLVLCHVTVSLGQTSDDAIALKHQLFVTQAYDKHIRPVKNQSDPIKIYVNLILLAINNLDEVTEVLQTTGYLLIRWYDAFLTWDKDDYGGLDYYYYPQNTVWIPDVALKNSNQDYKQLGLKTLNVRVDSDGYIWWYPFQIFQSTCSMNIQNFPFDVQECSLTFVAWTYSKYEVYMLSGEEGLILDEYEPNSAWEIINSSWSIREETTDSEISFNFKIKRKPLYFIISIVLPIILLAILNIFVFVLPCESGERAGYAVTVFLALAVFLTIISTTLPANSDTVAIFSIYLVIQTVQSTVITLIAIIMIRINSLDDDRPKPACVLTMMRCWDRLTCRSGKQRNRARAGNERGKHSRDDPIYWSGIQGFEREYQCPPRGSKMYDKNFNEWERKREKLKEKKKERKNENEKQIEKERAEEYSWKNVLNCMDCIFIIIFTSMLVIWTFVCFYVSVTA